MVHPGTDYWRHSGNSSYCDGLLQHKNDNRRFIWQEIQGKELSGGLLLSAYIQHTIFANLE